MNENGKDAQKVGWINKRTLKKDRKSTNDDKAQDNDVEVMEISRPNSPMGRGQPRLVSP